MSETINKCAEAMLRIMNELAQIYEDEMILVQRQDIVAINAMSKRKNELRLDYDSNAKRLAAQPSATSLLPKALLKQLKEADAKLHSKAQKNMTYVGAAIQATESLLRNIWSVVREQTSPKLGYSDPRKTSMMMGSYSPIAASVVIKRLV